MPGDARRLVMVRDSDCFFLDIKIAFPEKVRRHFFIDGGKPLCDPVVVDGAPLRYQLGNICSFRVFAEHAAWSDEALRLGQ